LPIINIFSVLSKHPSLSKCLLILMLFVCMAVLLAPAPKVFALNMERLTAAFQRYSPGSVQNFLDWQVLLRNTQTLSTPEKIKKVNEFFNRRVHFDADQAIWAKSDYWATPLETLAKGKGDCEDFTIAKYFTLLSLDIPNEQLRLIYVKARIGGPSSSIEQAHMVLAYYSAPDAEPLVLDNLITEVRPASRRPDLTPIFSFNRQGIYSGTTGQGSSVTGNVGQLSRWNELLQRATAEGFD
jgi:predicted transglutaminase-like cysteine proteinase